MWRTLGPPDLREKKPRKAGDLVWAPQNALANHSAHCLDDINA